jgi:hypothetical protein
MSPWKFSVSETSADLGNLFISGRNALEKAAADGYSLRGANNRTPN